LKIRVKVQGDHINIYVNGDNRQGFRFKGDPGYEMLSTTVVLRESDLDEWIAERNKDEQNQK